MMGKEIPRAVRGLSRISPTVARAMMTGKISGTLEIEIDRWIIEGVGLPGSGRLVAKSHGWRKCSSGTPGQRRKCHVPVREVKGRSQREMKTSPLLSLSGEKPPVGRLQSGHVVQSKPRGERSVIVRPSTSHNHLLSYDRLRRLDTEMDIRDWTSRLKKKFKPGSKKRRPAGLGAESGGERADSASSLVLPLPHVVTGGDHNQEDDGTNSGVQQVHSEDRLPPPDVKLMPTCGGDDDHGGEGGGADGREVSPMHSRPHSDSEVATGGGPCQEGSRADDEKGGQGSLSPSTPPIPRSGGLDNSTRMWFFLVSASDHFFRQCRYFCCSFSWARRTSSR